MNIPVLGIFFPIEEAIVITCIVILLYLIVFRFEFKQLSLISKKIGDEETELNKEIKELQSELSVFSDSLKIKDMKNTSAPQSQKSDNSEDKDSEKKEDDTNTETTESDKKSKPDEKATDTKSLDETKQELSEKDKLKHMLD